MKKKVLFYAISLILTSAVTAQKATEKDTVYLRYNGDISNDIRCNTIKLYNMQDDSIYKVIEVYRFTEPPSIKSEHYEDLSRTKHGQFYLRSSDGKVIKRGAYKNGNKLGYWYTYKDGEIDSKIPYKAGKKEGIAYYYFSEDDYYTGEWKNDKPIGKKQKYNEKGVLIFDGEYDDGQLIGKNIWYHSNGNRQRLANFSEGKFHGPYKSWYDNGELESQGVYKNGVMVGEWLWHRRNGKIASKEFYKQNGNVKKAVFYDSLGNTSNGKRHLVEGVIAERRRLNKTIKRHVKDNFLYPEAMQKNGFEGRIFVVFKIDKKGEVTDLKAVGDAHPILVEKAKEIIRFLPKQQPAKIHNILSEVPFSVPFVFQIND